MNSNLNSFNKDFNLGQIFKDCQESIKNIIAQMPLFIKIIVFLTLIFYTINLFIPLLSFYLVNIPYFTIFHFQLWRLFTTPFITTGFLSIVFSLLFWYRDAVKQEQEKGTIKYMLNFFMMNFFIQILYCIILLIISIIIHNSIMLKMKITMMGVRNEGLWPILMCDLTLLCLSHPEENMRFFFFPCIIKAKFYPLVLFCIFTILSGFNIDFEILCGIAIGFFYHYYLKDKISISNNLALKVENFFLCQWMAKKKGFISINNTGSPDIPVNLENINNNSNQNKAFSAFHGKGITVGGSNEHINRENVDYAQLATRNSEDSSTNETTLEINNAETN